MRGEVRFDDGARALYATDASNYRQIPIGVVVPLDVDDVMEAVRACREFGAPVLPRGGGTSLAGQCCNVAVVIDFTKHVNRVLRVDPEKRLVVAEAGAVLDDVQRTVAPHGLRIGPDPSTHDRCTIGGMVGNNSCGVHSVVAGRMSENLVALDVLTYEGHRFTVGATSDEEYERIAEAGGPRADVYRRLRALREDTAEEIRARFPKMPRRGSGYNLDELLPERGFHVARALAGSEGTCAIVLSATIRLIEEPPHRALVVLGYPDVGSAGDAVPAILEERPRGLEGVDALLVEYMRRKGMHRASVEALPAGGAWLFAEFGGATAAETEETARRLVTRVSRTDPAPSSKLVADPTAQAELWRVRESALGASAVVPGRRHAWEGWEDSAVPPHRLGAYLRDLQRLIARHGFEAPLYGHFGDGCVHNRITFDLEGGDGVSRFRAFLADAVPLVLSHGGSLSGEHGDGQARAEFLEQMFGPRILDAFRTFKSIWDPQGRMNPGKKVDAYRVDENLRLGAEFQPPQPRTHFSFPQDGGSLREAALRCVGVGLCRRTDAGLMCPSFAATRDEEHSTRGRARLLFEMLSGGVVRDGWRSHEVKDALDLCLSCKGCRTECPVGVDMARYKAEFLAHYYRGRIRPRSAHAFGRVDRWARLGSLAPRVANAFNRPGALSRLAHWAAGAAPERSLPALAPRTFRAWFRGRPPSAPEGSEVLLWPDTFTNHFEPDVAIAATEALERLGYRVLIPRAPACCGRPLYDYGMLRTAKRYLRRVLRVVRPELERGVPVVGLEPGCLSVFRDELPDLLPTAEAQRLSENAKSFSEFLVENHLHERLRPIAGRAVVQRHCHEQTVLGFAAEKAVLERLAAGPEVLGAGCCGMAGAFGFEREHYEVSMRIGERTLLPRARALAPPEFLVANGFSCRHQIQHGSRQRAAHIAQLVRQSLGP